MTKRKEELVSYNIPATVVVDGVSLPPGSYSGRRVKLAMAYMGQDVWGDWEYRIDYDNYVDLDCTQQVAGGSIKIT